MGTQLTYRFPFASYPAVRLVLLLALGIVLGKYEINSLWLSVVLFSGILFFYGISAFFIHKQLSPVYYRLCIFLYLGGIVTFGAFRFNLSEGVHQPPLITQTLQTMHWDKIDVKGTMYRIKKSSDQRWSIDMAVDTTVIGDSLRTVEPYNLHLTYKPETRTMDPPELGSMLDGQVQLYPLDGPHNPLQFDYKTYLASRNIYVQGGLKNIYHMQKQTSRLNWIWWRNRVEGLIQNNFSETTIPLAKALLIGDKTRLEQTEKRAFARVGLSHIMAVSGLHVGFLVAPFWILIPFLWNYKYGKQIGIIALIVVLFFYAGLTGFSASVTRASLTAIFLAYGKLFHKVRNAINLTSVSALIILLIDPSSLFDVGFQLSFSAVYLILLLWPILFHALPESARYRWYGKPITIFLLSLLIQLGLFPILTYYFGEFSIIGPLVNALLIFVLGIMIQWAFFCLILASIFPWLAHYLNYPSEYTFRFLHLFVNHVSALDWTWIQVHLQNPLIFLIWISAIGFFASLRIREWRWKMFSILLLVLIGGEAYQLYHKLEPRILKVTFFDVGQGDSILISTPAHRHLLIDTGRWSPSYNSGKSILLPYFQATGIDTIDAVILTHPHADHIGGLVSLMRHIPLKNIYNSGSPYNSKIFKRYHRVARQSHIPVHMVHSGDELNIEPDVKLMILGPDFDRSSHEVNEHSVIVKLQYGQSDFLFMGDAGKAEEHHLLQDYDKSVLDTDVLKVGHHGSRTSSSLTFLQTITPDISVVSLGKHNRYHHPHTEAIRRIREVCPEVHFTSLEHAVVLTSNGTSIEQVDWR